MDKLSYTINTGKEETTIDDVILNKFNYGLTDITIKRLRKEDMWKEIDVDCSDYSDWTFDVRYRANR